MKILNETRLTVIAHAEPTTSKDGANTYYRIAVLQNGQAANLSVSRDVYDELPDGVVDATLLTSYDDKYGSFRVESIVAIHTVNGSKPDAKTVSGNAPASAPGNK